MNESPTTPPVPGLTAVSLEEAIILQNELRQQCILNRDIGTPAIRTIGGADAAYHGNRVMAAISVVSLPTIAVIERSVAVREITFPYIPGFLAFREGPAVAEAFNRLKNAPDILIFNGHGTAHPLRFGLACHMGVVLGIRSIGVARRKLVGSSDSPPPKAGGRAAIRDRGEVVGMAVRPWAGLRPLYISPGHRTDLAQAVDVVLSVTLPGRRFPEPLADAHRSSRKA